MKLTKTKAPTIQLIVDLKNPGDYDQGWTLIRTNPKIYVNDSGEIFQGDRIIVDSNIRNTVKRGYPNPLENFYQVGDKVKVITRNLNITGIIKSFPIAFCGSQKDYIGLKLIIENSGDCLYRSDIFEDYVYNSTISELKEHFVYTGIISISKIYD